MERVPITFEHNHIIYTGHFSVVTGGANAALFHLMINGYFYGQLFYSAEHWQFYGIDFNNYERFLQRLYHCLVPITSSIFCCPFHLTSY